MTRHDGTLRAVVAVPLQEDLCLLIEQLEPRVQVIRDAALTRPARGTADWAGDPRHQRSDDEQARYDAMVDSADILFGLPDDDHVALARTVRTNRRLRCVMTTAAGGGKQIKAADLSASELARIRFATTAGVHGPPLAEFAVFGAMAGLKNLPRLLRDKSSKDWPARWEMGQISDSTVLIVGFGGIGKECASRFRALGATVWATSRRERSHHDVHAFVPLSRLPHAAAEADVVIVTLPETDKTAGLFDERLFSGLNASILVNVGRGSVVDERALSAALDAGNVAFAALDVFSSEPLPESSPLWSDPRVLISPHTAALTIKEEERIARRFAANATRLIDGDPLLGEVDTVEFY